LWVVKFSWGNGRSDVDGGNPLLGSYLGSARLCVASQTSEAPPRVIALRLKMGLAGFGARPKK